MNRALRAAVAAVCAAGILIGIAAMGNGVIVGLFTAPVASVVAFLVAWIVQRWRLGGVLGQQVTIVASTVTMLAAIVALILNRGVVAPEDILSGLKLLAVGAYAFWPAVAGGVVAYMLIDYGLSRTAA